MFEIPDEPLGITQVIQAARNGCFPKLKVLEISFPDELRMEDHVKPIVQSCRSTLKTLKFKVRRGIAPAEIEDMSAMTFLNNVDLKVKLHIHIDFGCVCDFYIENLAQMQSLTHLHLRQKEVVGLDKLAAFPKLRVITLFRCRLRLDEKKKLLKTPGNLKYIEFVECLLLSRDDDGEAYKVVKQCTFTCSGLAEN